MNRKTFYCLKEMLLPYPLVLWAFPQSSRLLSQRVKVVSELWALDRGIKHPVVGEAVPFFITLPQGQCGSWGPNRLSAWSFPWGGIFPYMNRRRDSTSPICFSWWALPPDLPLIRNRGEFLVLHMLWKTSLNGLGYKRWMLLTDLSQRPSETSSKTT